MWPWERKAYERGLTDGKAAGYEDGKAGCAFLVREAIDNERKAGGARVEEEYRRLGQLLWEARRELPDDSPMHARIREALDHSETGSVQLARIAKMFPGTVKPRSK